MIRHEMLYHNRWVSLVKLVAPNYGVDGYVYSHETRCNGKVVAVLPYRVNDSGPEPRLEVLLRDEITPCWSLDESQLSAITGGWEKGDDEDCRLTADRELWEEAGYRAPHLFTLGTCRGTKSSDTVYHLFGVCLTGVPRTGDGHGDGSTLEARATCRWVTPEELAVRTVDPLASVLWLRLEQSWIKIFDTDAWLARRHRLLREVE
jgi:8-oxo-dGTP pyrophosphatase MutT (NUDIX family)